MKTDGTIIEFLKGSHSFEGVWFGDKHPARQGMFWWRQFLPPSPTVDEKQFSVTYRYITGADLTTVHEETVEADNDIIAINKVCGKYNWEVEWHTVKEIIAVPPSPIDKEKPSDAQKLRLLVEWFDKWDISLHTDASQNEVQKDLLRIADLLETNSNGLAVAERIRGLEDELRQAREDNEILKNLHTAIIEALDDCESFEWRGTYIGRLEEEINKLRK